MILIKYATRGRPELFVRSVENIYHTTTGDFKLLISADSNDSLMNNNFIKEFISKYNNAQLIYGESHNKIHAINRDMDTSGDWDILVNMSDDMLFVAMGWDRIIREDAKAIWGDSKDWFAHYSDGYVHDKLPTMSIMDRVYYDRDKYIYHPSYKSFSCDAEAMYVAMMRDRYHYFGDKRILFKHLHHVNTGEPTDKMYDLNAKYWHEDTANYLARLNNYFDIEITPEMPIPFKEHIKR